MSDPRMIPADEAKQLREGITPGRWKLNEWESVVGLTIEYWNESTMEVANVKLAEAAPDLAHTVVEQSAQIKRLQAAIHKADKWGDILSDLYEDEFITEEDMQ